MRYLWILREIKCRMGVKSSRYLAALAPFMPNGFSRHYQLDESILNLRVLGRYV